jgi:hypothetical protein
MSSSNGLPHGPGTSQGRGSRRRLRIAVATGLGIGALMAAGVSSASAAPQYWLNNSQNFTNLGHCFTGYGPSYNGDLSPIGPTNYRAFTLNALFACSPQFPAGATLNAGAGTLDVWFTNTNRKSCSTPWFLWHNATPSNAGTVITGTNYDGNPGITVPAGTSTPTEFRIPIAVEQTTLGPNDQLQLQVDVRTGTGSCSNMTFYYGSLATRSSLSLPTLVG